MESRLVLQAVGVFSEASHQDGWWLLSVRGEDVAVANAELEAYRQENESASRRTVRSAPRYGGAKLGFAVYLGMLIYVAVLDANGSFGFDWDAAGRVEGEKVLEGQWWRCVTALTLHVDVGHLIGNLVFGAVFGLIAGRILGGGVAWLAIVLAGSLGNWINTLIQPPTHISIGASTAVFASLGLIVFDSLRQGVSERDSVMRRWSPLIAGLVLFAYTGMGGEQTDVGAHATGMLAGVLLGWLGSRVPESWLGNRTMQASAGAVAILLVVAAWILAWSFNRL